MELFKKSTGAVRPVILSCDKFTDDELVAKLRSCFSHAPTMNEAREELWNMSLFLCTCIDGEELSIDHQEFNTTMRDIPM